MNTLTPFRLHPSFSARTWGRRDLKPWYPDSAERDAQFAEPIGEAWLTGPQSLVNDGPFAGKTLAQVALAQPEALLGSHSPEGEFPLLIKLLFPDAKLSVQVHPNDDEARARGLGRGKTECWYILEAQPGATVACGLNSGVTTQALHAAILDGTAEALLQQVPVSAGDMVFVDAGTVHAIGSGVTILEIQQTSDTTYRLYDYGRPRELHVQQGLDVTKTETRAGKVAPTATTINGVPATRLIAEQYFTVDHVVLDIGDTVELDNPDSVPFCLTAIRGDAEVAVAGNVLIQMPASSSVIVPATTKRVTVRAVSGVEVFRMMP